MSELDWPATTIGNVCAITTGKLDVNASVEEGAYPFFTCAERVYRINEFAFDTEAVLFAGNGFFNVKYYKGKFNAYQRTYVLHQLKLNGRYLFHYISHRMGKITGGSRGSTIKYIRLADLRDHPIRVPSPEAQEKIVSEIETQLSRLDDAVANLQRVKANLKRYKASVLKAAVEGHLVETEATLARREGRAYETGEQLLQRILEERRGSWKGRGKYADPVNAASGVNFPLPEGWSSTTLETITDANRVICYGILMPKENLEDGVLFVKVRDMRGDSIDLNALHRTSREIAAQYARASLRTGDILLSIRGTYGRVAVVPPLLDGGNITQDTARIAVSHEYNAGFVAAFLRSEDAQRYFKQVARGVAVKGVNIGDVRPMPIPVPPLAEQVRIVAEVDRHLSIIREVEAEVDTNLQRAQALRQSTLAKAFSQS